MSARAAFLRALPAHDFAPPEADVAALGAATLPLASWLAAARFEVEVGAYAAEFWALSPADRRARWDALTARAIGPAATRLAELWSGLAVIPVSQTDPDAAQVASLVCELFTLPKSARTVHRFDWLVERGAKFRRWVAPARVVLRTDRLLPGLDLRLFDWFVLGTSPSRIEYQTWIDSRDRWRRKKRRRDRVTSMVGFIAGGCLFLWLLGYIGHRIDTQLDRQSVPSRGTGTVDRPASGPRGAP